MTITLDISPEMEQQVREEATRRGLDMGAFAQQVFRDALEKTLPISAKQPRIAGLNAGQFWMSDDFNAPLPDSFWLGEEETSATNESIGERAHDIYERVLCMEIETEENIGKVLLLNVDTGVYEINTEGLIANERLRSKYPDTNPRVLYAIGGSITRTAPYHNQKKEKGVDSR